MRHGFVDHLRDYELMIDKSGSRPTPDLPDGYHVVFRKCVAADVRTSVAAKLWRRSLGNHLLDIATAGEDETSLEDQGYVWV
jgi:hypothetical protein